MPTPEPNPAALGADPSTLNACLAPLAASFDAVRAFIAGALVPEDPALADVVGHVTAANGKMLRPAMVLLAGQAAGTPSDRHTELGAVVEMIHTASLLHDDVLDRAEQRRGRPTANHLYGNAAAVLLGDFVLSRVFEITVRWSDPEIGCVLGRAAAELCQGELRQNLSRGGEPIDEEAYLGIVRHKTAALFHAAGYLGSYVAGGEETVNRAMGEYGSCFGMAFQIRDDVMDLVGSEQRAGKTLRTDLAQRKLTLPWIHFLKVSHGTSGRDLFEQARGQSDATGWIDRLRDAGSIDYAWVRARAFVDAAVAALGPVSASPARDRLEDLARSLVGAA